MIPIPDKENTGISGTPEDLSDVLRNRRFVVLTGAGCSTESGIPDYRGPLTRHKAHNPIQFKAFISDAAAQRRYWARSIFGWQRVNQARPNAAHLALARLEAAGVVSGVITQNVDRLHQKAGSVRVIELHGTLSEVCCLSCLRTEQREGFQHRLEAMNPDLKGASFELAPDGDAELDEAHIERFNVPACARCAGVLKPNVVFFGENVPKHRVEAAWKLYEEGDVLLVVGSSLAVYSGYRFVVRAARDQRPVALVNLGSSRGDRHAAVVVNEPAGAVLNRLADALLGPSG
jgi:NAD-dependent SIR2 family protein deacetylase